MNKFFPVAFAAGLAVLGWIAWGFAGTSWLALAMTAAIAAVYLLGAFELRQFRAATAGLAATLDATRQPPPTLTGWLQQVPPALREAVRLRVEGERGALPAPALTPYLVGLLVMLGMLGTFLGMVVTFNGTVFALERSTDLQAMRSTLAEPIRGLGLSFGTSVAGVAASAMLGLMSAVSRRERLDVARKLEGCIAGALQPFSLVHQRQEGLRALQLQSAALPALVDRLDALMERMERRAEHLDQQLLERHAQLQREVTGACAQLARDVGGSLRDSLAASAGAAGDVIRPVVETAMAQVGAQTQRLHERLAEVAQAQAAAADALARARTDAEARWLHEQGRQMEQLAALWRSELTALREQEAQRGDAAVARLGTLEAAVAQHLATLGSALEEPLTRLLRTAAEVPQAAAGVIAQLREEMGRLAERDNLALHERTLLLEQLRGLLQAVNAASGEQRAATEALLACASDALEQAGTRFARSLEAQAGKASETAAHVAAGAVELASVAESFAAGVQQFQSGNDKLVESLERMEASLRRSTARSDEQLAYYVAQAREVIDLSIASQQGLVENLRSLQVQPIRTLAVAEGKRA